MTKRIISTTIIFLVMLLLMNRMTFIKAQQGSTLQGPAVIEAVAPVYPDMIAYYEISGTIVVQTKVDSRGDVSSAHSIDGNETLRALAESSARKWIFVADNNRTSERVAYLTFRFKIMPKETPTDELSPIFSPPYTVEVRAIEPDLVQTPNIDPPGRGYPQVKRKRRRKQ